MLDPDLTWTTHRPHADVVRLRRTEVVAAVERGRHASVVARRDLVTREPGVLTWSTTGKPLSLMSCTVVGGRIVDVIALVDPARLASMDLPKPPVG